MKRLGAWAFFTFAVPVVLIIAWTIASETSDTIYFPSPIAILAVFPDTWFSGAISGDIFPSLSRLAAGFGLALIAGVGVGTLVGMLKPLRLLLEPIFELFRAVPPPVLVPIIMLVAGIGDGMKIAVIAFGCVWPILINTVAGVRGIDEVQLDTAASYRFSGRLRFVSVILPAATPQIVAGARQSLAIGIIMMVISEMFAATNGLGFNIIQFQRLFLIPEMWSGIILLGLLGVGLNAVFKIIENRLLTWHVGLHAAEK
ncbi:ABC transporter permease [Nesterenkonia haasae]|uniref:ABC transporter permease n=1 Tax=Nesterenkonia haasae TaxID=2587813 RepID=UPI001391B401|nr:ABC transporter permease [Nesterenkonia haasae]NDK31269.1 ABC transporter permease [Nesterenkonia haasae]